MSTNNETEIKTEAELPELLFKALQHVSHDNACWLSQTSVENAPSQAEELQAWFAGIFANEIAINTQSLLDTIERLVIVRTALTIFRDEVNAAGDLTLVPAAIADDGVKFSNLLIEVLDLIEQHLAGDAQMFLLHAVRTEKRIMMAATETRRALRNRGAKKTLH